MELRAPAAPGVRPSGFSAAGKLTEMTGAAGASGAAGDLVATGMTTNRYSRGARAPPGRGCRPRCTDWKSCKARPDTRKLPSSSNTHMALLLGAHTIDIGGIDMAALRAGNAGMSALQIFTTIPKYYGDKQSIRPERVERFKAALAKTGIAPQNVVVHSAYVLNTASNDEAKWMRARDGLAKELERSTALGVGQLCFHPGAATGGARASAAKRVAKAITHA